MVNMVLLVSPFIPYIPAGLYKIEHENLDCYVIEGVFHNKKRFIKLSSLLLELL